MKFKGSSLISNKISKHLLFAFVFVFFIISNNNSVKAAQSIAITPTQVEQNIQPGSKGSGTVQVLNQADTPFDYTVYVSPYSVTGEDYDPNFYPVAGATKVSDWVKLSSNSGSLKSYTGINIDYTINIPKDAKPGGYYAVIFAETRSKIEGSGVETLKRVGSILYIRVAGNITESGKVTSWEVPWYQQSNLNQVLRIENTGGSFFTTDIKTEVKDLFGGTKFSYNQKYKVLPEKIRKVNIKWDKTPPIGIFKVSGKVEILGKTTDLPTKYVLILNESARNIIFAGVGLYLFYLIISKIIKRKRKLKRLKNG